jgi:CheY-like chemotaxis protein
LAPVDTKALLEELIALLSQTFPKAIELTSDLERNLPTIVADKNQLAQALLNLCLNARDAMPAGGKLVLQTSLVDGAGMSERFQAAQQDGYICIRLTDTGCGMDEPTRSRIFEPFFTTKPKGQGTGLGLSVVYGIVRNHAGFIDVESAPNEGTTFHIYLPIRQGEVQSGGLMRTIAEKTSDGLPAARRGTVLFVDDEENQVRLMQGFLERNGYSVLIARDGAEAIEVHQRHKDEIALVILDLGLPKLNGWQAFQRMRQLQPDLGALFATGFLSPEAEAEMHKGQPVTIIQKPYDLDELLAKISAVIRSEHANSNAPVIRQDVYRQP